MPAGRVAGHGVHAACDDSAEQEGLLHECNICKNHACRYDASGSFCSRQRLRCGQVSFCTADRAIAGAIAGHELQAGTVDSAYEGRDSAQGAEQRMQLVEVALATD